MGTEISSVTASEFLLFHTRKNGSVDYYVINFDKYGVRHLGAFIYDFLKYANNSKWAKMGSSRTDSIIINFSRDHQSYRIFGNEAITTIINNRNLKAFKFCISHLDKRIQKMLKKKMEFILDNGISCHSVNDAICNTGMILFEKFSRNNNPKNNIKNTMNDILILSTAIEKGIPLRTADKVLNRFAANEFSGKITKQEKSIIVKFPLSEENRVKVKCDSKGYINKGWFYSFSKGNL